MSAASSQVLVGNGKPPTSLHQDRLIKSIFALKVVADPSHIGPSALADFSKMRSVKTSLGEQFTGNLEHAVAGGQRTSCRRVWPICFLALSGCGFHSSREFVRAWMKPALTLEARLPFTLLKAIRIQKLSFAGSAPTPCRIPNLFSPRD